jgi:hypothetical protein
MKSSLLPIFTPNITSRACRCALSVEIACNHI